MFLDASFSGVGSCAQRRHWTGLLSKGCCHREKQKEPTTFRMGNRSKTRFQRNFPNSLKVPKSTFREVLTFRLCVELCVSTFRVQCKCILLYFCIICLSWTIGATELHEAAGAGALSTGADLDSQEPDQARVPEEPDLAQARVTWFGEGSGKFFHVTRSTLHPNKTKKTGVQQRMNTGAGLDRSRVFQVNSV